AEISYPEGATSSGTVVLELTVDASGNVTDARLVSDSSVDQAFGAYAVAQARAFRYEPALRDGRPVAARIRIALYLTPPEPEPEPEPAAEPVPRPAAKEPGSAG